MMELSPAIPRSFTAIAVIDISPWVRVADYSEEQRAEVVRQWDDAFHTVGFAAITGTRLFLLLLLSHICM